MRYTPAPAERPPALSLLTAAETGPVLERVEQTGFIGWSCGGGYSLDALCTSSPVEVDDPVYVCEPVSGYPFRVEVEFDGSVFGNVTPDELRAAITERFNAIESAAIARELWTGDLIAAVGDANVFDHPTLFGATVIDATVRDPKRALAEIEDYLAAELKGPAGMIYATRGGATVLPEKERTGNTITTTIGTPLAVDAGFTGAGPDGTPAAAGTTWVYASSRPIVSRSATVDLIGLADVERGDNSRKIKASRLAWVAFECGAAAVKMNLV